MNAISINRPKEEYNVCFQGSSLDVGNLGCCALTASFIKLVVDTRPNAKIYLLYANRTNGVQSLKVSGKTIQADIINCRLSPKSRINEHLFWILLLALLQRIIPVRPVRNVIVRSNRWLRTLDKADFVGEIRGGDSFSDIYGSRLFLLGIIPCLIAILMRKNLVLLPQTYGPFKARTTIAIARFILLRADRIFARDKESIELVRKLLEHKGKEKIIEFCPDVAFILEAKLPEEPDIQPKLDRNNPVPLIGLNISSLLYMGGYTRDNMFGLNLDYKHFVPVLLEELMKQTNARVLLVPHMYSSSAEGDELQVCHELYESIGEEYLDRIQLVNQKYDQSQIKGIIGLCDFFIGSRMHACIAALSQNIPTVGLAYSKKFYGVFESVDAQKFAIDMRQRNQEEIIEIVISAFEERNIIAQNLKNAISMAQNQIRNVFKEMLCQAES